MKNTLKTIALFTLLAIFPVIAFSQEKGSRKERQEKVKQMKVDYFTEKLSLTSEETEKFWTVYDEMETKLRAERKKQREIGKDLNENRDSYSDSQLKEKTDAIFDSEMKAVELKKEYNSKIAAVIGRKKATKLLSLEREFKKELLKKMKKGQRPPHPPRPEE